MSTCSSCKASLNAEARFCGTCGAPVTPFVSSPPPPPSTSAAPYPPASFNPSASPPLDPSQPGPEPDGKDYPEGAGVPTDLPSYQGYGEITLNGTGLPPPPPAYQEIVAPERNQLPAPSKISEDEARQALLEYVSTNCCYGKKAAQQLHFSSITASNAYHYSIESFTEIRTVQTAFAAYLGGPVDGPENGIPPHAWSILATAPALFKNFTQEVEVPHTSQVRQCHTCLGLTKIRCNKCFGRGRNTCSFCHGSGRSHFKDSHGRHHRCNSCMGRGTRQCMICRGMGRVNCPSCLASGMVRFFLKLTITWEVHLDHKYFGKTDLPDHLLKDVKGDVLLSEEGSRVAPLTNFPENEINQGSQQLLQLHQQSFGSTGLILRQRQVLRQVPVSEIAYSFKDQNYRYFVYGQEHKVYDEDYPQKCCCGCSIL